MSSNGATPEPIKHAIHISHNQFTIDGVEMGQHVEAFSIMVDPSKGIQVLSVQMVPDFEFNGELDHITLYIQCKEDHNVQPDA